MCPSLSFLHFSSAVSPPCAAEYAAHYSGRSTPYAYVGGQGTYILGMSRYMYVCGAVLRGAVSLSAGLDLQLPARVCDLNLKRREIPPQDARICSRPPLVISSPYPLPAPQRVCMCAPYLRG